MLLHDVKDEYLQRDEINFLDICNANEGAYGAKGSNNQRSFQKVWSYYLRMALPKYMEILYKHKMTPGEVTARLFRQDDSAGKEEDETEDANENSDK